MAKVRLRFLLNSS